MRKTNLFFLAFFALGTLFNACSTDVDLHADYKDITVVYGLLDSDKDVNYVKINKAFLPNSENGNANEIALIADSCNYPNKLDAKIIEYRANANGTNYQKTRELVLDTMTIHNKKPDGFFYHPDQLVYYTNERVYSNTDQYKYKYELQIDRGDTVLMAETEMVGGYNPDNHIYFNITTAILSYAGEYGTPIKFYPCPNAAIYEVVLKFYFTEIGPSHDSVLRCMEYSLGNYSEAALFETLDHNQYVVKHKSTRFYSELADYLGKNCDTISQNIKRIVQDNAICISIAAGGEELYNFISVNGPSSSIVQSIPEYTNVRGGYGVFSSRTLKEKRVNFNSLNDLKRYHPRWGFDQGK